MDQYPGWSASGGECIQQTCQTCEYFDPSYGETKKVWPFFSEVEVTSRKIKITSSHFFLPLSFHSFDPLRNLFFTQDPASTPRSAAPAPARATRAASREGDRWD